MLTDAALKRRLAKLHEIGRREDWEAFNPEIENIIAECANAAQLWRLAESDPFWESAFGEEGPTPGIVLAVLARVRAFEQPNDKALALALATRMIAVHPGMPLFDDETVGQKNLEGVPKKLLAVAREVLSIDHRSTRIAALHALGCVRKDAARVASFASHADDEIAATALLSAKKKPAARRQKKPSLVLECLLLRHQKLDARGAAVLARAMRKPVQLPAEWGWRWEPGRADETSAHLALKIVKTSKLGSDAAPVLVSALAEWAERDKAFAYLQDDVLIALAFGDLEKLPDVGLTRDELTPEQKVALRALSRAKPSSEPRWWLFGLHDGRDVAGFLAGRGAMWQPLEVKTKSGPRRWHLKRLWPECVLGRVTEGEATRAIVENLKPAEALAAICGSARGILLMLANSGRKYSERDELRDTALVFGVVRGFAAEGADVKGILQGLAEAGRPCDLTTLGLALACAFEGSKNGPKKSAAAPLARASAFSAPSSPVHALIEKLPATLRTAIDAVVSERLHPRTERTRPRRGL